MECTGSTWVKAGIQAHADVYMTFPVVIVFREVLEGRVGLHKCHSRHRGAVVPDHKSHVPQIGNVGVRISIHLGIHPVGTNTPQNANTFFLFRNRRMKSIPHLTISDQTNKYGYTYAQARINIQHVIVQRVTLFQINRAQSTNTVEL